MNRWERAQLVNSVLVPCWLHRLLLLPWDRTLHQMHTMLSDFVREPKGMETSKNRHLLSTPVHQGGLGLRSIYRAYRRRSIASMQYTIRVHAPLFLYPLNRAVPHTQAPILTYVALLQSLGAIPGVSMTPIQRRPCGPDLIDSEDTEDGRMITAQRPTVGNLEIAIEYGSQAQMWRTLDHGEVPRGFSRRVICGFETLTNDQVPTGQSWHSDGSKCGSGYPPRSERGPQGRHGPHLRAIAGNCHGPWPADLLSGRAEGALCSGKPCSSITLDNKAVVDHGPFEPHREASDMDVRCQAATLLQDKHITVRWIPGHRTAFADRDARELDDIHRNNEVDWLAKLATPLPLPLHTLETPASISVGGTEAPTPASKWIAAVRPYTKYEGLHSTTWLPPRGVRRHMWIQWVWGNVRWCGCSPPWERCKVLYPFCSKWHIGTTHARLAPCDAWLPVFVTEWVRIGATWSDLARHWISTASVEDLDHISKLRVPQSFFDIVPYDRLHALRYRVAWHQYHMAHAVILLCQSLPMPPRVVDNTKHTPSDGTPVWYIALCRRAV